MKMVSYMAEKAKVTYEVNDALIETHISKLCEIIGSGAGEQLRT